MQNHTIGGSTGPSQPPEETARGTSGGESRAAARATFAQLLELTSNRMGPSANLQLYRTLENLDREALIAISEELERAPQIDPRLYPLRSAVRMSTSPSQTSTRVRTLEVT